MPFSVSWNAGLMKLSPGPLFDRMVKWIQKKNRYRVMGRAMSAAALAMKCFVKYSWDDI